METGLHTTSTITHDITHITTPFYLNHHSQHRSTLSQPLLTSSTCLSHHSQAPHYLNHHSHPHYLNHHSQHSLHTTSTITHNIRSTLPQSSFHVALSTPPHPSLTSHTPHYLDHHSHSTLPHPSLTLHTTSTITHNIDPHYLNHHSRSTLPQP